MTVFRKVSLSAIVACCLCALALLCACGNTADQREDASTADQPAEDSLRIELIGVDSISVLDLLQASHAVDYEQTANGAFIKSIDSVANGGGHYWLYLINGKPATTAADKYVVTAGDTVTWIFRGGY